LIWSQIWDQWVTSFVYSNSFISQLYKTFIFTCNNPTRFYKIFWFILIIYYSIFKILHIVPCIELRLWSNSFISHWLVRFFGFIILSIWLPKYTSSYCHRYPRTLLWFWERYTV
jgi:hypothetical protein